MIGWLVSLVFAVLCLLLALFGAAVALSGAPVAGFFILACGLKALLLFVLRLCR